MNKPIPPKQYFGPFVPEHDLGIDRMHYIALKSPDPKAAAEFAAENMGFFLVHVDEAGRHYLSGHGHDNYSLVYVPGDEAGLEHLSFVLFSSSDLERAATLLERQGVAVTRIENSDWWKRGPAVHFELPSGQRMELTLGVNTPAPMASIVAPPADAPAPICADHAILRVTDLEPNYEFVSRAMGLRESARITNDAGAPILGFFRSHTLFHCFGFARSGYQGIHHIQFTLKNPLALYAAYEAMKEKGEVELLWGPLRHGAGHNMAFYFHDKDRHLIEYSVEEEIVLNDEAYVPRVWSAEDRRGSDEWEGTKPPWFGTTHVDPVIK
ncbi:bleomycin resistance protein [Oceanicola sp. D3]|uniref:VOC family protein n=1 Tax=Oceanicola sp. D3 TaxID=2587163 RepID=UPI0011206773|nr:VOC family protein [Oceanicola sp. D3]QDC08612.1 bleomycin resistance protein [Oceanicola sp. D3]